MNIWWIRRDLRLTDNAALFSAREADPQGRVLPVYILDDTLLKQPAEKRQAFLFAGLRDLAEQLRGLGSNLVVRRGDPRVEIPRLVQESSSETVYAEEDVSPYARQRDAQIALSIPFNLVHGLGVHPVTAVTRTDGAAYTVFTPYSRAWKALPFGRGILPAPERLPQIPDLPGDALPDLPVSRDFPAGEGEALRRLHSFMNGAVEDYAEGRNLPGAAGTSILSPYLRFGMLSARQAAAAAREVIENSPDERSRLGAETWLNELIWREFYQSILYHFPEVLQTAFNRRMRNIAWRNAPADLLAWQEGRTGTPLVDAGMRQLAATGWMHNRVRMVTASFLVKDLLINWQEGERWFMRMLVDGDPAANNGGWQWTAGTGTDAAPYFRVFNPVLQGKRYDPRGEYVRRWVPELADVPDRYLHAPWEMPLSEQRQYGCLIGRDYPAPIVDHADARQRVLETYRASTNDQVK